MKKLAIVILMTLTTVTVYSQSPDAFSYQAVAKDNSGSPLSNQNLSFRMQILEGSANGNIAYSETHNVTSNEYGQVQFSIGQGVKESGIFSEISWGSTSHFLSVNLDETGGNNYSNISITQLLSVPYALHANTVSNKDDADADPGNEIQDLMFEDNKLSISGNPNASVIDLAKYDVDNDSTNELQLLELVKNNLNLVKGEVVSTVDLTPFSNVQALSLEDNILAISGGNSVVLPSSTTGVPDPTLPVPIKFQGGFIYVHPSDNNKSIQFGGYGITSNALSDNDGQANTAAIIATAGANGGIMYAAKLCDDLVAFGYDDWYLPSRAEMDAIYKQAYLIEGLSFETYWTSTEGNFNFSYLVDYMNGGEIITDNKKFNHHCRCVRK